MKTVSIRQSGGSNIVSIPKVIAQTLNLTVGSKLDLSIRDNCIVLTPIWKEPALEKLLAGSPGKCFAVTEEDREWIDAAPIGKEI